MENMDHWKSIVRGGVLSLILIALYHFLVTSLAVVDLQVVTDSRTKFKVYYSDSSQGWSEDRAAAVLVKPGITHYSMRLGNLKNIDKIRIDTSEKKANIRVVSLVISQPGFTPVRIDSPEQFKQIEVGGGVEDFSYSAQGFVVKPATTDPNIFYTLPSLVKEDVAGAQLVRMLAMVLVAFALAFASRGMFFEFRFVLPLGLIVLTLIVVMASISRYNQHPDERVHVVAAKYYMDHNLPPVIGDPAVAHTYSIYGMSRLNSGEISYFFAGKFAKIFETLQVPEYRILRFFNVSLNGFL